ncbi:hypothetical protein Xcel_3051 [Xylanimonas cellulosilytica DSM 15894]|uniref:Uncharacterized protein n=1 Tax=Xylanimonas cellulosilytica (strain DSM 15894 / JCM 12276 / CECT 5975 / KCTC 9989 / LMG 20990 / NBRC 107835 / XIL07) TaxID=446471 RepID=D1BZS6_XYLCX|nr:hypothetical protein [Xylanimonas cellulosilytica]ACZ32054.1 hypothetical protein Xcel_3051 [Xylanimonas cellulosilytica DSM 15894]
MSDQDPFAPRPDSSGQFPPPPQAPSPATPPRYSESASPSGGLPQYGQAQYGEAQPGYGAPGYGEPAPAVQPKSIATAVKLMYVGAALSVLGLILNLTQRDAIADAVRAASPAGSTVDVDALVGVTMAIATVSALIGAGLWTWMAIMNGKGRSWARVLSTILGGLSILSLLASLAQPGSTPIALIQGLVSVALAATILVLLWRKESSAYYQAVSAQRLAR